MVRDNINSQLIYINIFNIINLIINNNRLKKYIKYYLKHFKLAVNQPILT